MVQPPSDGHLDLGQLAVVSGLLAENTTTPEAACVGIWNGYGELHPGSGSVSIIFAGADDDPRVRAAAEESFRRTLREAVSPEVASAGGSRALIDAIVSDPALEAAEVGPDTDLTWQGDSLNPMPQ